MTFRAIPKPHKPLLAGHLPVAFNLFVRCSLGRHIIEIKPSGMNSQLPLGAGQLAGDARVVLTGGVGGAGERLE
jgi:hypothetical protein